MKRVHRLRGAIQPYAWGSRHALAELLGRPAPSPEPEAELWLGAHPSGPAEVELEGAWRRLDEALAVQGLAWLGAELGDAFGPRLPFLLKVLAVERPLSIQVHPDADQAREGFARDRAREPRLRRYVDPHPKPELVCALTPFSALCGFRPLDEIRAGLERVGLGELLSGDGEQETTLLADLVGGWFGRVPAERERLLDRALGRAQREAADDRACALLLALAETYPGDPGLLAPFFLNAVELAPGEALFLGPGEMHCYLAGTAVEIMAASDNVLRAGLTPKAVHLDELLRVTRFAGGLPPVRSPAPRSAGERVYETPAAEFELSVLEPEPGRAVSLERRRGVEILLCTEGAVRVTGLASELSLARGESCLVPASAGPYRIEGRGRVFRAAVPLEPRPGHRGSAGRGDEDGKNEEDGSACVS